MVARAMKMVRQEHTDFILHGEGTVLSRFVAQFLDRRKVAGMGEKQCFDGGGAVRRSLHQRRLI